MSTYRALLRHSAAYSVPVILGKMCGFLLLPVYTRYLSPSDYGVLELLDLTLFMLTSLSLSILATNRAGVGTTVLQEAPRSGVPAGTQPAPMPASQAPAGRGSVTIPLQLPPRPAAPGQAPANTPPAAPKK